jgi:hypothetical protein
MPTCDAFPQGIPLDIINGQQSHRIPYAGDSNIRFERIENQRKTKKG